ncbi:MAG TPA: DUF2917 domain-containing protein [Candidatus Binatia bacterium]|nr:DUF2917 domain-containing protein [Candidatus Binatia bacterium]
MKREPKGPDAAGVSLPKGSLLRVEGIDKGAVVRCFSGALWVTQEGDVEDHFLDPGEKCVVNSKGLVIVQVLEDARIGIEQGNKSCLPNLTLIKREHLESGPL